jgi:NAD(P)-dependent dehydrogenase (short-subunit alcohol dehydrogenase family)
VTAEGGRLDGVRVIVTGGASGIGAATVERFAAEGAAVLSADIDGGDVEMDVTSSAGVAAAIAEAVGRLGGLDVAVCNAGVSIVGELATLDESAWDRGMAVNLKGVFLTVKHAWPHLVRSRGVVLATSSAVGLVASGGQAAYCASKAGVAMLMRSLALEGAPVGVRANSVCPGFTVTPHLERFFAASGDPARARADAESIHPLGRLGRPEDVAEAFVYLAGPAGRWVTGVSLPVDGGMTTGLWGAGAGGAVPDELEVPSRAGA